jgi:hypothetical protein
MRYAGLPYNRKTGLAHCHRMALTCFLSPVVHPLNLQHLADARLGT